MRGEAGVSILGTSWLAKRLHMQATRDREGSYAFVYFPMNDQRATIELASLKAKRLRGWWFDPRTGIGAAIERRIEGSVTTVWTRLGAGGGGCGYGIRTSRLAAIGS